MVNDLKSFSEIWNRIMYILSPSQKRWGIVVFGLSLIGSLVELLGISVILPYIQSMTEPSIIRDRLSFVETNISQISDFQLLFICSISVIIVYFFKNIYLIFLSWIRVKYSTKVQRELSIRMIKSYVDRGFFFFRTHGVSVLLRGCRDSISGVQMIIYHFFKILAELLTVVSIFVYVFFEDMAFAIAMMAIAGLCMLLILFFFRRRVCDAGKTNYHKVAESDKWLLQIINGIREVMVTNRQAFYIDKYEKAYIEKQRAEIVKVTSQEYPAFLIEALCIAGLMLALLARLSSIDDPTVYIPKLATFAMAAFRILPSMGRISMNFNGLVYYIPSANEVYDNVMEANKLSSASYSLGYKNENNGVEKRNVEFSDRLEIRDITYQYPDGKEEVLSDVSISIKKGEAIALVGPSGSGKTTIADIVLGLLPPQNGSVYMDGIDVFLNREMWAHNVGFVPQTVYLMDDTVRRNIAFGCLDTDIDDDKVWRALEKAQMDSFIKNLPDRLDTMVGERGVRFSGGQTQRLAIARALYSNPQILILDEATSALDNETESAVMDAINALQGEKTLLIIAHRVTTVKNCDHIYEIRDGRANEIQYEELVRQ